MEYKEKLKNILQNGKNMVFFGGAGVSTESGIPDFRGEGGIYKTAKKDDIPPEMKLHCNYLKRYPKEFFENYRATMLYPEAHPNGAHLALARLEEMGKLSAVVTQNIDGLHQMAGSKAVLELHGSVLRNYCMKCGKAYALEAVMGGEEIPTCPACGGMIRPDVVLYGEGLDGVTWARAEEAISRADVLIVGGTSLTVQPAASLVSAYRGRHLILINQTPTPYDRWAELRIREPIGEVFSSVMAEL